MEYKSNIRQVFVNIEKELKDAINSGELQRIVATDLLQSNLRRVHNEGRAVSNAPIGSYATRPPLYVNPKRSPLKFAPKGKRGNRNFKNGRPHRTGYFDSYKAFRQAIGRETSVVNLQLSSRLRRSFAMEPVGKNWNIGFVSEYGAKVSGGQEQHWGKKIWGVTRSDSKRIYNEIIPNYLKRKLRLSA